ncbi:hypothetical protein KBY25_11550 [Ruegeria pomeroyi]|nr:hypothetical protein [Ruegeria pomeroyi]
MFYKKLFLALFPAIISSPVAADELAGLLSYGGFHSYIHEPFCEDGSKEVKVTMNFFDSNALDFDDKGRVLGMLSFSNNMRDHLKSPSPNCLKRDFLARVDILFMGEPIGKASFSKSGYDMRVLTYDVNVPSQNSAVGEILLEVRLAEAFETKIGLLQNFASDSRNSIFERQIAYFQLALQYMYRDREYGPEGEMALLRAAEMGSSTAALELVKSTGLWDELYNIPYNARHGKPLISRHGKKLFSQHGNYLSLAMRNQDFFTVKLLQTIENFGVSMESGTLSDTENIPHKYAMEDAILRAASLAPELIDAYWRAAYPEIPKGFMANCDEDWCHYFGGMVRQRFSVSYVNTCEGVSGESVVCSFKMGIVTSLAPNLKDFAETDAHLLLTQGLDAPHQDFSAAFTKINDRWELTSKLEKLE